MSIERFSHEIIETAKIYNLESGLGLFEEYYKNRQENVATFGQLFCGLFPLVPVDFLIKLSNASNYYYYSILAVDQFVDKKKLFDSEALLFSFVLREKSLRIMYELFEPKNLYWSFFDNYYKEYLASISYEINYSTDKKVSVKDFEKLYAGKGALLKATITAMAIKTDKLFLIESLERSIDFYQIALGICDDITDWREDWENNQFNYLIYCTLKNNNLKPQDIKSPENLGKYIVLGGEVTNVLKQAIIYYRKSKNIATEIGHPVWIDFIEKATDKCMSTIKSINQIIK